MKYLKDNYASLTHTFLSTFILFILGALASTDPAQLLSAKYWTINVIVSIVSSAIRAGIKAVSPLK